MPRVIRVAHLITDLSLGGAEAMLHRLVEKTDASSFRSLVISLSDVGPIGRDIEKLGVQVVPLGMLLGRPSASAMPTLIRVLRSFRPDILQTWLYHADLLGLLASGLSGRPKLLWNMRCSNMDLSRYSRLTRWVVGACARLSPLPDAVISNSEAGRSHHAALGYRPKRWELIPNGLDLERFRPDPTAGASLKEELGIPQEALLIGLVARFDAMKDHRTFLESASALHRQNRAVRFVLCGRGVDWDNAELVGWVDALGLKPVAHLLGERRDVARVIAAMDILASSSCWGEGFPNVIGEAMACAVPCVATDVGDSATILGEGGRVVPPKDADALARALDELIMSEPQFRRELGMSGRRRIGNNYSLPAIVDRYENLYREIAFKCVE